jgi:hypothetical protein
MVNWYGRVEIITEITAFYVIVPCSLVESTDVSKVHNAYISLCSSL